MRKMAKDRRHADEAAFPDYAMPKKTTAQKNKARRKRTRKA
jgi:hypothetical protein